MATKFQLVVDDVVQRISAPIQRIIGSAARATTATPFVGEQYLGTVIVEGRGVPVSKALV